MTQEDNHAGADEAVEESVPKRMAVDLALEPQPEETLTERPAGTAASSEPDGG